VKVEPQLSMSIYNFPGLIVNLASTLTSAINFSKTLPTRRLIDIDIDPSNSSIIEIDLPIFSIKFHSTIDLIEIDLDIGRKLRTLTRL
jgi:hypothetical protein